VVSTKPGAIIKPSVRDTDVTKGQGNLNTNRPQYDISLFIHSFPLTTYDLIYGMLIADLLFVTNLFCLLLAEYFGLNYVA
jgi:hypothetical protein